MGVKHPRRSSKSNPAPPDNPPGDGPPDNNKEAVKGDLKGKRSSATIAKKVEIIRFFRALPEEEPCRKGGGAALCGDPNTGYAGALDQELRCHEVVRSSAQIC